MPLATKEEKQECEHTAANDESQLDCCLTFHRIVGAFQPKIPHSHSFFIYSVFREREVGLAGESLSENLSRMF